MKVSALLSGGTGGGAKLPTSHTLHYWPLPLFSCLPPPVGYFWEILVGILTLFLTKNFIIHTHFQTWPPKARPVFRPKIT